MTYGMALLLLIASTSLATEPERISLNGEWSFAADYLETGEHYQWFSPKYKDEVWDKVTTPHVWSMDQRFPYFMGNGWYRRQFLAPGSMKDQHVRLVFEAVYARSKIWLNGKLVAEHDGGHTPFEIDVSPHLDFGKTNLLVVCADNRWREACGPDPQHQGKPWMEDGGLTRDAYLVATPPIYVAKQKIEAVPDLATGLASIRLVTWVRNTRSQPGEAQLTFALQREEESLSVAIPDVRVKVPAGVTTNLVTQLSLSREHVRLWSLDTPVLYRVQTTLGDITTTETFGIRKFEVRGSELLLNGCPVRLAGANRVANGTEFGQNDPPEFVERDLRLMKEAGLEFMRMHHVPLSRAVLDWSDRHGLLLIEECSHATPVDLDDKAGRASYQSQAREMIERDWNRPSIVAWSVGNEFASETPAGLRWVRDMMAHARSLDATRLLCFASNRAANTKLKPEDEASSLTDFVCLNTYGSTPAANAANIDRARQRWPDKPFIVTEFGLRADRVANEADRERWFAEMIRIFRERPFISGVSLWTFNDYRSRHVGTNPDGYRWWGLVDAKRTLRGAYHLFRQEFTPVWLKEARMDKRNVIVKLAGRTDFPVYPPTDYQVRLEYFDNRGRALGVGLQTVTALAPGGETELTFQSAERTAYFKGEIRRGDFLMMSFGPTPWSK